MALGSDQGGGLMADGGGKREACLGWLIQGKGELSRKTTTALFFSTRRTTAFLLAGRGEPGEGGSWLGRDRFRFRVYCVSFLFQNCSPLLCVLWRLVFKGKNIARFPNLVPQLFLFFVNFYFSYFCIFFKTSNINVTLTWKINYFKNDA